MCASAFGGAGCSECADLAFFERTRAEPRAAAARHRSADCNSQQAGTQLEESESRKRQRESKRKGPGGCRGVLCIVLGDRRCVAAEGTGGRGVGSSTRQRTTATTSPTRKPESASQAPATSRGPGACSLSWLVAGGGGRQRPSGFFALPCALLSLPLTSDSDGTRREGCCRRTRGCTCM